ncbi:hypothetical protein AB0B31_29685 [Catellatospora citrea]|uniref:hypothetical protein n=1 Tax=Catellatospora citrea TaxID=53366 RepID=UPI0034058CBC
MLPVSRNRLDHDLPSGIEDAVRLGQQARGEVVSAIVTAQESMSAGSQHLSRTVVDLVTKAGKPLELPAAPPLPPPPSPKPPTSPEGRAPSYRFP